MSKYNKSEKRFNFIDVLIILSVLLILSVTVFRAQIITFFSDSEHRKNCVIHFQSESIPNENLEYLKKEGVPLYWLEQEQKLGTLSEASASPYTIYVDEDGDGKYDPVPDEKNAVLMGTISASVLYDEENGCFVGGTSFIAPGMVITIYSENIQFKITITEIEY